VHDGRLEVARAQREQAERAAAVPDQEVPAMRGAEREALARVAPALLGVAGRRLQQRQHARALRLQRGARLRRGAADRGHQRHRLVRGDAGAGPVAAAERQPRREQQRVGQEVEHLVLAHQRDHAVEAVRGGADVVEEEQQERRDQRPLLAGPGGDERGRLVQERTGAVVLQHDRVQRGPDDQAGHPDRARQVAGQLDGPVGGLRGPHAVAAHQRGEPRLGEDHRDVGGVGGLPQRRVGEEAVDGVGHPLPERRAVGEVRGGHAGGVVGGPREGLLDQPAQVAEPPGGQRAGRGGEVAARPSVGVRGQQRRPFQHARRGGVAAAGRGGVAHQLHLGGERLVGQVARHREVRDPALGVRRARCGRRALRRSPRGRRDARRAGRRGRPPSAAAGAGT
jgi:hypothetical protein